MGYEVAINKAWQELAKQAKEKKFFVKFLADEYEVNLVSRRVLSVSCNVLAKEYLTILILHYLSQKLKGLPVPCAEWISFKELPGGLGYYEAFSKRVLEPLVRKYGRNPLGLLSSLDRLPGKKIQYGDCGIVVDLFEAVPVLITVWAQDDEFSAEANVLFDRTITQVFCTEDIVVLSEFLSKSI